jgi:signal peptidase I
MAAGSGDGVDFFVAESGRLSRIASRPSGVYTRAPNRSMSMATKQKQESGFAETVRVIFHALLIALIIRTFLFQPFNIPSGSMKNTLLVGDYLFVSKFSYGYGKHSFPTFGVDLFDGRIFGSEPDRGDVAVFRNPVQPGVDFIKRIVGLPGDRIQMIDGVLNINEVAVQLESDGTFADEDCRSVRDVPQFVETLPNGVRHLVLDDIPGARLDNTDVYVVPDGHYFAMGDNRDHSADSRVLPRLGYVPAENLIGRAEFIFFSVDGCGSLWNPLTWPETIRWSRLFMSIE